MPHTPHGGFLGVAVGYPSGVWVSALEERSLVLYALPLLITLSSPAHATPPSLLALQQQALQTHPSLEILRRQEHALRTQATAAGVWADPILTVEYSNVPLATLTLTENPMSGLQLRAQQTLRPPGWSPQQRRVGEHRADVAGWQVAEARNRLQATIAQTWWMLEQTHQLEGITQQQLARTEESLVAVRVRYETGGTGQYAVLQLEVLRDRLQDELGDFDQARVSLLAALRAASGVSDLRFDPTNTVKAIPPPPQADWIAVAQQNRPLLHQLEARLKTEQHVETLARIEGRPDLTVWAGYRLRSVQTATDPGTDLVSAGVSVPIPAGSRQKARAEQAAAASRALAIQAELQDTRLQIQAGMETVYTRWVRAAEKASTYEQRLIPKARATLETTRADFAVGRADFASLFEAEIALLDLERARIRAVILTHLQQAEAMVILGALPASTSP